MGNSIIEEKGELLAHFENGVNIVLSTSDEDLVTSRTVTVISFGDSLYLTSIKRPNAMKIAQIEKNANVALCANTMQITGTASIIGLVSDVENNEITVRYKEKLADSYERFAKVPSSVFIKIDLTSYKNWKMVEGKIEITDIDFVKQTVTKNII